MQCACAILLSVACPAVQYNIFDFKLLPCPECCELSFGWFPGVWILYADVLEHSVSFSHLSMKTEQSVPKRRNIKFRRRGITQKKAYNIQDKAKVWNQDVSITFHLRKITHRIVDVYWVVQFSYRAWMNRSCIVEFTEMYFKLGHGKVPLHISRISILLSSLHINTGLLKMIVAVLTTCHKKYTWDSSI